MSDVPSADIQPIPRDSRHIDRTPNGSPGPLIDSQTYSSQGSLHNPPPIPLRNGFSRSGSPLSFLRDRRPQSTVPHPAADLPTRSRRRPSNAASTSGASTSGHPPSLSTDMNSSRLASPYYILYVPFAYILIVQLHKTLLQPDLVFPTELIHLRLL